MESNPLISVIVPIYNVRMYLKECIESICNQSYNNIQIILVDDGSTDGSGCICENYKNIDKRISVIHKENGGLVSARKAGIERATGEYIAFVDGDDWIDINTYEQIVECLEKYGSIDIISFGCVEEYADYKVSVLNEIPEGLYAGNKITDIQNRLLMGDTFFEWYILPHLCDKIIKKHIIVECIDKIPDKISFGEDAVCSFPCILKARSLLSVNITPYHYRQREGSIVRSRGELECEDFTGIYSVLTTSFSQKLFLNEQLKFYMFFLLMLKGYSKIGSGLLLFPFERISEGKSVFVYGAGGFGKVVGEYIRNSTQLKLAGWTDVKADYYKTQELNLDPYDEIFKKDYDYLVIAILNEGVALKILDTLTQKGIDANKIDYVKKDVIYYQSLPGWITD